MTNALSPRILQPSDSNQNWSWDRPIPALGHTAVDFERRVDHDRLRRYRLSRAKNALKNSTCGSILTFDVNNIRYITGTKIGEGSETKCVALHSWPAMMNPMFGILVPLLFIIN